MSRLGRRPTADELALWRRAMEELLPAPPPVPSAAPEPSRIRSPESSEPPAEAPPAGMMRELDAAAWRRALAGVVPLGGTVAVAAEPDDASPPAAPTTSVGAPVPVRPRSTTSRSARLDPRRPVDLDRRSWLRLRRGQYPIDTRLDLHGLNQEEAHALLDRFLLAAAVRGSRCVLVITGQGIRRGGALRQMTPRWLDEPPLRARVIAYAPARREHGGEGALYVLLRRAP